MTHYCMIHQINIHDVICSKRLHSTVLTVLRGEHLCVTRVSVSFCFLSAVSERYGQGSGGPMRPATAYGFRPDEQHYYSYSTSR